MITFKGNALNMIGQVKSTYYTLYNECKMLLSNFVNYDFILVCCMSWWTNLNQTASPVGIC